MVAESLYNHWASHAYEVKRQSSWQDAPDNLRGVFLRQGEAVVRGFYGD